MSLSRATIAFFHRVYSMGESSPEPLDELDEEPRRRVIRWQSVRVVGEPNGSPVSRGLRRTGTVPSMRRPPRRGMRGSVTSLGRALSVCLFLL
ncbi:hypothetical protein ANCDUO_09841 [Ancylostoma duodenale]|uniref:Uncharacterized protein n=1 Tax=Ancylostoma duodenale TaxID=51022 RepID=A0A0C2GSB0_9BILA|nr:hypothetical protein ANCDUO_09841 [Ancylostoma duodenale]